MALLLQRGHLYYVGCHLRERNMSKAFWAIVAAAILVLAASCATTEYTYAPPQNQEGRQCVTQCQATQSACRNNRVTNASAEKQSCKTKAGSENAQCKKDADEEFRRCDTEAQAEYLACLKFSTNRAYCLKKQCFKKSCFESSCSSSADFSFCDSEYRACYQNCGGSVGVMQK